MKNYPTPHINATPDDFAPTVVMPGDPLRSKFIAENFLGGARLINNVRGVQGYTGTYKGKPVTVMASGMGMPSMGIYSYELYNFFGVESIIRVGSCGALRDDVKIRDLVFAMSASTDSNYGKTFELPITLAPTADYKLLKGAVDIAEGMGLSYHVGNILSSDVFYGGGEDYTSRYGAMGILAVEMESTALYLNAAKAGKRALTVLTVSDSLVSGQSLPAEERQSSFTDMMAVALELAVK